MARSNNEDAPICLDQQHKDDWFHIMRSLKPGLTEEEYEKAWQGFVEYAKDYESNPQLLN